jgi:hypothetical protein
MGFENLTEDVKAKAMDCETVEEREAFSRRKGSRSPTRSSRPSAVDLVTCSQRVVWADSGGAVLTIQDLPG